jgi:hypothetical protein
LCLEKWFWRKEDLSEAPRPQGGASRAPSGEQEASKGSFVPVKFQMTRSKFKSLKERSNRKKNLMAEEKNEKDSSCDTCSQTSSCNQEEKEAYPQERLKSALSRIKHRPGSCTIPDWIQRWALGD